MKSEVERVNAGEKPQRFEISHQAFDKIPPNSRFAFVVKIAPGLQIFRRIFQDDDGTNTHQRNCSRN